MRSRTSCSDTADVGESARGKLRFQEVVTTYVGTSQYLVLDAVAYCSLAGGWPTDMHVSVEGVVYPSVAERGLREREACHRSSGRSSVGKRYRIGLV